MGKSDAWEIYEAQKRRERKNTLIWIIIIALVIGIPNIFYSDSDESSSQLSSNNQKAINTVQNYNAGGQTTVLDAMTTVMAGAKQSSNKRIEIKGWSAFHQDGNNYRVYFTVSEAGQDLDYIFETNTATGEVYTYNSRADDIMNIVKSYG